MRSFIPVAFLAFTGTFALSGFRGADADTQCLAVGRPCACVWHVRECLPACKVAPRFECAPTNH
jgi:hypothetical protein